MSGDGFEQSVDVLRRSEADYKAKCTEVAALRQRLADQTVELDKTRVELRRQEIRVEGLTKDVDKRQKAVDIIVKELTAKKQIVEAVQSENARLKRDLEAATRTSEGMQGTLRARSIANNELTKEHDAPAALYMQRCFSVGVDPNVEIMRCLFADTKITCTEKPATYQQLGTLVDVLEKKKEVNAEGWQPFESLSVAVDFQETFHQVCEIISLIPSLKSVELVGLGDPAAAAVAAAISTSENITSLSLPDLCVSDAGFTSIMKVLANREILSIQKGTPMLIVNDLDLSNCLLQDYKSLQEIHGQCLANISLAGNIILNDSLLLELIRSCPALTKLSLAGCTTLTNEALTAINRSGTLTELDLTACTGITHIKLDTVEVLTTTLCGVTFFECPKVRALPKPLTHFQCLSFKAPELKELSFQQVSLNNREFTMLSDCGHLTHLTFVSCRLMGLEVFLRRMRRLLKLSIHSCKGVMDADVMALCSTIEVLDLTECFCVTDKALTKITDVCRQLKELTVKRCSNITDGGILTLEKLDNLEYLNVLGAKKVTVLALHRVISASSGLKTVVHENLISAAVRVDHDDEEEVRRTELSSNEKALFSERDLLGFQYHAVPSPTKPSASGSRLNTPADGVGRRWLHSSSSAAGGNGRLGTGNNSEAGLHSPIPRPPTRERSEGGSPTTKEEEQPQPTSEQNAVAAAEDAQEAQPQPDQQAEEKKDPADSGAPAAQSSEVPPEGAANVAAL